MEKKWQIKTPKQTYTKHNKEGREREREPRKKMKMPPLEKTRKTLMLCYGF